MDKRHVVVAAPRVWTPQSGRPVTHASRAEIRRVFGLIPTIRGGALLVPNQAEDLGLQFFLNKTASQDLRLKLFTNNQTPGEAHTEADYTEMGAVQSYAYINLVAATWTITPGAPSSGAYPQQTWTFTAGGPTNVYGYFVIQQTSGKLMWAERFSGAPFVVQNNGDQIQVTLQITLE
jgi:hypothetical protein